MRECPSKALKTKEKEEKSTKQLDVLQDGKGVFQNKLRCQNSAASFSFIAEEQNRQQLLIPISVI